MKIKKMKRLIKMHYSRHGVNIGLSLIEITGNNERYIFQVKLKPGAKESLIFERASDIRIALQLPLFQPFKNGLKIYLAVSDKNIRKNSLWDMLNSPTFRHTNMSLLVAMGYDMRGRMIFADLAEMPHVMYAGSTNSGKSVGLTCLILSLLYRNPAQRVNLLLFDVISDTMKVFEEVPQLSHSIIKDAKTGAYVVKAVLDEMKHRTEIDPGELASLPAIVCVLDEYLSFLDSIDDRKQSQEIADDISYLLRCGRHAKIYVVLSTQEATKKSMRIDLNSVPARVAFACAKYQDSITVIGEGGAEKLPGKGALLFRAKEYPNPIRLQGAFMALAGIAQLVSRIKSANHDLSNKFVIPELEVTDSKMQEIMFSCHVSEKEKELADIIMWTLKKETISVNQIKECFSMGNRANDIMQRLFEMGIVEEKFANQPRKVLPKTVDDIPEELANFLHKFGFPKEAIEASISARS